MWVQEQSANVGICWQRAYNKRAAALIRGVDYQEQQLGELDRWQLDELCSTRPMRIQHRSGKVWSVTSALTAGFQGR